MNQSNSVEQNSQQEQSHEVGKSDKMQDEGDYEESNNFTQRQISIIRSYIEDLNIQAKQDKNRIQQISYKIQKETQLQIKSAKQIQEIIHKLINSQNSYGSQIFQNKQPLVKNQEQNNQSSFKLSKIQQRQSHTGFFFQNPNQQSSFMPKSLFKSFNQKVETQQPKTIQGNFAGVKKVNLFTTPSIQLIKKSSNGFMTVKQNNNFVKQEPMQVQNNGSIEPPSFSKKGTKQFKQTSEFYISKSKRKIKPQPSLMIDPSFTVQERFEWIENNTSQCHSVLERKLQKLTRTTGKQAFYVNQKFSQIYNQYFYSNYDKVFFNQENQFSKLLNQIGADPKRIDLKTFKLIKQALPSPKLFNIEFVISQQNRLNEFRSQLRQLPKERARNQDIELVVGRQVIALHPVCGHLHSGSILAIYKQNQYMVKFSRPQLGTQKILDINICTRSLSTTNKATIQNIDYQAMVTVIKLLQYKGELIQKFKEYNNMIEDMRQEKRQPDNKFLQQYGWIGSTINILTMGMRHIIAKFRIRGLNTSNQELVSKNFSSLLINPLNLMSKQLENSSELSDVQTSNHIKRMATHRSQSRIQETVTKISLKNDHFLNQSQMNPEQKENMSLLLKNFLAMLLNLRFQGRNFNIESNKYLNNILAIIDGEYAEYFNQIYANIHSLVKKIAEVE